jgi:hypothetical protein
MRKTVRSDGSSHLFQTKQFICCLEKIKEEQYKALLNLRYLITQISSGADISSDVMQHYYYRQNRVIIY